MIFAFPLVLFRNMDAMSALKESIAKVKPDFVNFLLLCLRAARCFLVAEIVGLIRMPDRRARHGSGGDVRDGDGPARGVSRLRTGSPPRISTSIDDRFRFAPRRGRAGLPAARRFAVHGCSRRTQPAPAGSGSCPTALAFWLGGIVLVAAWSPSGSSRSVPVRQRSAFSATGPAFRVPGCGVTRSIAAMLRGDYAEAFTLHPLAPFAVTEAAVVWVAWGILAASRSPRSRRVAPRATPPRESRRLRRFSGSCAPRRGRCRTERKAATGHRPAARAGVRKVMNQGPMKAETRELDSSAVARRGK